MSANNPITNTVSDPESRMMMEDYMSGNLQQPTFRPVHSKPVEPEPVIESEPVVKPEPDQPPEAVLDRAETIASIKTDIVDNPLEIDSEEPHEVETTLPHKKRRWWVWIIILIILLGIAAAVYLKWDFVHEKITSLIG